MTFVGRLDRQKGLFWLLASATVWLPRSPQCDLLLVGEGPERRQLEDQCRKLGIAGRVHFAGWRPDIAEILAHSRLLVLPSAWEGMPNAVLEAMAARLPVVATDVEGVRELLGPADGEQIVPLGDTAVLADKLTCLLNHAEIAAEIGARNRRRVEENFSLSGMVAAYEKLWESVLAGP